MALRCQWRGTAEKGAKKPAPWAPGAPFAHGRTAVRPWANRVADGLQSQALSPLPHSGGVKFLEAGQRCTYNPLSSRMSVLAAEPNQTVIDEHRTVSMMAE